MSGRMWMVAVACVAAFPAAWAAQPVFGEAREFEIVCKDWHTGEGAEWQWIDLDTKVTDWRGYDRISLRCVCEGPKGMSLSVNLGGRPGPNQYASTSLKSCEWRTWTIPIRLPAALDPANVRRIRFYTSQPHAAVIRFADPILLSPGEPVPPLPKEDPARFVGTMRRLLDEKIGELSVAETDLEELRGHQPAYLAFREACDAVGQREAILLGWASTMEKVRPRAGAERSVAAARSLSVRLARGEYEGVQLIVSPRTGALRNVRVSVGPLRLKDGTLFPASNVLAAVTGYLKVTGKSPYPVGRDIWKNGAYRRESRPSSRGWYPEPILAYTNAADVAATDFQSFWLRFHAERGQKPGVYRGQVTVSAEGVPVQVLPLGVRVNAFTLPVEPPLPTAITWGPEYHAPDGEDRDFFRSVDTPRSPVRLWQQHKAEWREFLADYYISMDSIYKWDDRPLDVETFVRLKERGRLAPINLGFWYGISKPADEAIWRTNTLVRIKKAYAQLKAAGLADYAYAYGCDEAEKESLPGVQRAARILKAELPDVPLATTARDLDFGVGSPLASADWFVPQVDMYDAEKAAKSREAGHKVWWYICCKPHAPSPNMFVDSQAIEARLLHGAMAARMRPDGFLIYQISIWNSPKGVSGGPFVDYWSPRTWRSYNGDGCWTSADKDGRPLPTLRLENYRDGVEDLAYVRLLEKKLRAHAADDAWAKRARTLLSVPDSVVKSTTDYTDDPAAVYAWRNEIADLLER